MNKLEELYLSYIRIHHRKALKSEEYITYMNARREFSQKLSEEQLIEFEKLMDLKLDVEDNEGIGIFKNGFLWGIFFSKMSERYRNE